MNVTARTLHGYPINLVLGSCMRAAAPDPARYCWCATLKITTQATESRLKLPGEGVRLGVGRSVQCTRPVSGGPTLLTTYGMNDVKLNYFQPTTL